MAVPSEAGVLSSLSDLSSTNRCLLPLLHSVRQCLHTFLSVQAVVRLMQTSHATALSILSGYTFVDRVFTYHHHTVRDVKRSLALYSRCRMRILRMSLPERWNEPLVDAETGRPHLPSSLLAVELGQAAPYDEFRSVAHATLAGNMEEGVSRRIMFAPRDFHALILPVDAGELHQFNHTDTSWDVFRFGQSKGAFNQPIPPGALPHKLRFLQFASRYNQPLQVGSIPDTVKVLQFGAGFNQRLDVGHLPASLTHLVLGSYCNQPLLPGVLPAGLQRLHLGMYDHQLQSGTLPPQLQQLSFGRRYNQPISPGAIPSSVTHVKLSDQFDQQLQMGSIPHGVMHLNLGNNYNQPLLPGVLPNSLRQLVINIGFTQPLLPGSLPDGLEMLAFHKNSSFQHIIQPGVIPASVRVVSMNRGYKAELVAGGFPATVKWLRLPEEYLWWKDRSALSTATCMQWWEE